MATKKTTIETSAPIKKVAGKKTIKAPAKVKVTETPAIISPNSFAVIELCSHQYTVRAGDTIKVEKLELKEGEKFNLSEVLLFSSEEDTFIGTPFVVGATVELEHIKTAKGTKIRVARYRHKSRYHKVNGHRQMVTELKVIGITKK